MVEVQMRDVGYLGVDLHCQEKPEAGVRLHRVELFLQLHQPPRGQVDILQHHPPARLDSSVDVSVSLIEALSRTCEQRRASNFNSLLH